MTEQADDFGFIRKRMQDLAKEMASETPLNPDPKASGCSCGNPVYGHHEQKLRELGGKLAQLYTPEEMAVWLFSAQQPLNWHSPAALVQRRRTDEVIRLVDQILEGAYV
jgi:hypothetical protein